MELCPDDNNIYSNSHRGLLNGVYRTIIYITILTEDSWNGVHRTITFITISTEVLWNGVQITIIDKTIPTDVLVMMSR